MKTLTTLFFALLITVNFSNAQSEAATETNGNSITVTIQNITNNKGNVVLALHTESTFMKSQGIKSAKSKIVDGKITVTFKNVVPGTYAIMALHDENENNRMDFDASGMPKESYGMSNNPMSFGPPQYTEAKFEMSSENLEMTIKF